jgi:ribonuclease-3
MTSGCSAEGGSLAPPEPVEPADIAEIEARLGCRFRDRARLVEALTHRSRAVEGREPTSGNDRLEFLGDAVLSVVISEALMEAHPRFDEGDLSLARSQIVRGESLAEVARSLGVDRWMRLGRGEEMSGGRDKASILANVFEAILGAIYLDGGLEAARTLVIREMEGRISRADRIRRDVKTRLQELLHQRGRETPRYELIAEDGPPETREYRVAVTCEGEVLGRGASASKREAEREAAREALAGLET